MLTSAVSSWYEAISLRRCVIRLEQSDPNRRLFFAPTPLRETKASEMRLITKRSANHLAQGMRHTVLAGTTPMLKDETNGQVTFIWISCSLMAESWGARAPSGRTSYFMHARCTQAGMRRYNVAGDADLVEAALKPDIGAHDCHHELPLFQSSISSSDPLSHPSSYASRRLPSPLEKPSRSSTLTILHTSS